MIYLADFLGNVWWTALVFVGGGVCALAFKPLLAKLFNK